MRSADPLASRAAKTADDPAAASHARDLAAARRVFDYAGEAIADLGRALNGDFNRAVETILAIKGRVVVSGMGKSGLIGRKIASTLASTGTPALFVHPGEASHGDLGAVTRDDALLMLSYRGETAELSDLITYAKRFAIPLIAIASTPDSTLMQAADVPLLIPSATEACPLKLAPTTSTTVMLVLGDALAVALMERKSFSPDQYRDFHPGGSLGRMLIRVSDLMRTDDLPFIGLDAGMAEILATISKGTLGCVVVVDGNGATAGIITHGDVGRSIGPDFMSRTAGQMMTRTPHVVRPDQFAAEALGLMNEKTITQLLVLDPADRTKKPLGILHIHDCLRAGLQ
jgi:arabinose-5-phosphate isomerase